MDKRPPFHFPAFSCGIHPGKLLGIGIPVPAELLFQLLQAEVDSIDALEGYRGQCQPVFLFYAEGELVAVVRGVNAPLLQKTILEQLAGQRKVLEHGGEQVLMQDRALSEEEGSAAALQGAQREGQTGKAGTVWDALCAFGKCLC
ncbi:thioredoxin domain-containing protein 6 isoform X3 [Empidonax traillii]|uniref:thioredoxin domain-containing protein 6 isoform X3 n=1 Tax=Empidonax traillii TaxID=164674 RepID=UPI000FFD702A|nr:thioredoxin domain-containing protein 6 isoform X3 [Empidonax traillii]